MKKIKHLFSLSISIFVVFSSGAQDLIINEVMSDNESFAIDDMAQYFDWIEIYNPTDNDIALNEYYLSDDIDDMKKWRFPNATINSNEYLLVYASDKDYNTKGFMHTNFKINSDGEEIFLVNGNVVCDNINVPDLLKDHSYGRKMLDGEVWVVFNSPSPRTENEIMNCIEVSPSSGFYDNSQQIYIESFVEHEIRFTTDGSIPTLKSPLFEQGIIIDFIDDIQNHFCDIPSTVSGDLISYPEWIKPEVSMTKGHIMKFASFNQNVRTSEVQSRSYFVSKDDSHDYSMPVISLIVEESDFFSDSSGIYTPGTFHDLDDPEWSGNFFESGNQWERPAHMVYFNDNMEVEIEQNIGVRIHGGKTRNGAQKSLRLYARSEYGKSHLEYNFLPNTDNDKYKRLLLRTTMGAWGGNFIFKDEFAQSSVRDLNVYTQDSRSVIVIINGEYWGVHSMRDRMDEDYLAYTLNVNDTDVEIKIEEEENADFEALNSYIELNDLSEPLHYNYVQERLDIDCFIDYNIVQMYYGNYDWPVNNLKWWREIDGKWKNLMYDLDAAFLDYEYNMFEHNTNEDTSIGWPNPPRSTLFFRKLLENKLFEDAFIERYLYLLESTFHPDTLLKKLFEIKEIYDPELSEHIARWSYPSSESAIDEDIETRIVEFIKLRPCIIKSQIESFFEVEVDFNCQQTSEIDSSSLIDDNYFLFPNPAKEFITLLNKGAECDYCDIEIINDIGQLVYQNDLPRILQDGITIDLEGFTPGVYFVIISAFEKIQHTKKFVVH